MTHFTNEQWSLIFGGVGWALLILYIVGSAWFARREERRRDEQLARSNAPLGSTACPACGVWDHDLPVDELPAWRYVEAEPGTDGGYDLKTCRCGHTSAWIDGPGLMLNIPMPANAPAPRPKLHVV